MPDLSYTWGCVFNEDYQFTYLYGPTEEWSRAVAFMNAGYYVEKGHCETLETARDCAVSAASVLNDVYHGAISVTCLSSRDFASR